MDRTVAIKRSAEAFSERFAALNHAHICTLHDIGPDSDSGFRFIPRRIAGIDLHLRFIETRP